jgi:hypothetical protein
LKVVALRVDGYEGELGSPGWLRFMLCSETVGNFNCQKNMSLPVRIVNTVSDALTEQAPAAALAQTQLTSALT